MAARRRQVEHRAMPLVIDIVTSWYDEDQGTSPGFLRPSLKGSHAMKQARADVDGDTPADLLPSCFKDSESAVTCLCFGQQALHLTYILLAAADRAGAVAVYRLYRTKMEINMLGEHGFSNSDSEVVTPPDESKLEVNSRLTGHSRIITAMVFTHLEDKILTSSVDKSIRLWMIASGAMLACFIDKSPVHAVILLPLNPNVFVVAATAQKKLRVVSMETENGVALQKLQLDSRVHAFKFDDKGCFLFAGTKDGKIHLLKKDPHRTILSWQYEVDVAQGRITCVTFVPDSCGQPPRLLVNCCDNTIAILDCMHKLDGSLDLVIRHRVRVAGSILPLRSCYSPSGQGYLISGSEDASVCIYPLGESSHMQRRLFVLKRGLRRGFQPGFQYLKGHNVAVAAVAVNAQDTVLASADLVGRIVLWRRMDS